MCFYKLAKLYPNKLSFELVSLLHDSGAVLSKYWVESVFRKNSSTKISRDAIDAILPLAFKLYETDLNVPLDTDEAPDLFNGMYSCTSF